MAMRIENLTYGEKSGRVRTSATVTWEDGPRGRRECYFETPSEFSGRGSVNPHSFLVACTIVALRHGERRITIDARVCPELKVGLTTAMRLLRFWADDPRPPVSIEFRDHSKPPPTPSGSRRAAFCFTGGIDSLATLRMNRLNFRPDDPGYIQDGVLIFGLEIERLDSFNRVIEVLSRLGREADVRTIPVYTNIHELDKDWRFWSDAFEAAVLASVGHTLHHRIRALSIGSSFDYRHLHPHGSHPLLDPNYSSSDLQVRHDSVALSRLEKTWLVAEWETALRALHVCNRYELYSDGIVNCGSCEKCLRTLTALLVTGQLGRASTFARRDVTPELIAVNVRLDETSFPFWNELLPALEQQGRDALAVAVSDAIRRYRGEVGWQGALKRLDRVHLHGSLRAIKRTLIGPACWAWAVASAG
jgi:hypothetical protein